MKENYTKPLLAVEMFTLAQTVARECASSIPKNRVNMNEINTCAWDMGGGTLLFLQPPVCNENGEDTGFVCYHNPGEGSYIFRS